MEKADNTAGRQKTERRGKSTIQATLRNLDKLLKRF